MKKVYVTGNNPDKKQLEGFVRRLSERTDEHYCYYGDMALTINNEPEFDGAIVINGVTQKEAIQTVKQNVVAFMMEPGIKGENRWMYKGLNQFGKVISPIQQSDNTLLEHGYISWFLSQSREELLKMPVPEKKYDASCIASGKTFFKGHRKRLKFVRHLRKNLPSIHFFGFDDTPYLPEKETGLFPYRFSVAIENSKMDNYFTEKINDCFLSYTLPFYYGCTNIHKFFPKDSYIWIDIDNYEKAEDTIRESIAKVSWEQRLPLLQEARELILNKYHFLARMDRYLAENSSPTLKTAVTLHPVPKTLPYQVYKKIKKMITKG
jgi:hypothetical protein